LDILGIIDGNRGLFIHEHHSFRGYCDERFT
jgi:hypothetical protein